MPRAAGCWLLTMLGQDVGFPVPQGGAQRLAGALAARSTRIPRTCPARSGLGLRDSTVEKREPAFKRMIRIRHRTPCAGLTARIDRQQPRTCPGRAVGLSASVRPDPADVSGASRSSSRNTVVRTPLYPARCPTTHAWSTTAPGHSVAPLDRPPDAMMNHGLRHRHLGRWLVDKHPHW